MKFGLKFVSDTGARRGLLSGIERIPGFSMDTPNILLYTQGGAVPHLTPDTLAYIKPKLQVVVVPIPSIAALEDRMKKTNLNLAEFVGLKDMAMFVTIMDPGKARLEGFHKTDILSVQTRSGKKEYTPEAYMDFIENIQPDLFTALCDGDTNTSSSVKRVTKSSNRSLNMLTRCKARWQSNSALKNSSLVTPLEGGVNPEPRKAYSEEVLKDFKGEAVVIDGLGQYGDVVAKRQVADVSEAISASLVPFGKEKLRVIFGPWHPREVLHLVELGIDVFDSSYAHLVTERGLALLLTCQPSDVTKKARPVPIELNLFDPGNSEVFEPISDSCTCFTCKNHTRAYIHHLLTVKEMLASVLLHLHNLQQYQDFFATIRDAIDNGTFQELKERFQ